MNVKTIQYLPQQAIDKNKWDNCIAQAPNGLIYAYSFYLDHLTLHWDALVLNDYEAVMPLPWNKKWGINYSYHPLLVPQLGIFGKNVDSELANQFIQNIPTKFKLAELSFNCANKINYPSAITRSNYLLNLQQPHSVIYGQYNENLKRNIKKSEKEGLKITTYIDIDEITTLAIAQMKIFGNRNLFNEKSFSQLYQLLLKKNMAINYGVFNAENKLLAAAVFFFSHKRAYYILAANHLDAQTVGASHALVNQFIKDYSGKELLLDFEGSDIPSLARFYSSFGAVDEAYISLKINNLPYFLRWLKS